MRKLKNWLDITLFNKELEFRARLLNVLGLVGALVGFISTIFTAFSGENWLAVLLNLCTVVVAVLLLIYIYRTGNYQRAYLLSISFIFLFLFPFLFFINGGYISSMPYFFIFAVVFTVFMLDSKQAIFLAAFELIFYTFLFIYAYLYPENITPLASEKEIVSDIIIGFLVVSVSIGATFLIHIRMYKQQQKDLQAAREEALQYSEAKSNFLASMSHEIRTPINVITGMNEMVLRESTSEEVTEYALSIRNAGRTLSTLVSNILDVSKIESGNMEFSVEPYKTRDLIRELSDVGAELTAKHGLYFSVQADESLPSELLGDSMRIKQVTMNFISNAVKYTNEGEVKLIFGWESMEDNNILLRITVADTGIGIKEEELPDLFEAFSRAETIRHRHIEGAGLGLAISKQISKMMGGRVLVESEWQKGSVFTTEIPQRIENALPIGKEYSRREDTADIGQSFVAPGGHILIVDDNKDNHRVVKSLLARTLLKIDTAESGAECLELATQNHYDVILMDYMMPEMDGEETLRNLQKLPGFTTPVVVLTANAVAGVREKFLKAGFAAYLAKPVDWQDLEETIASMLPQEMVTRVNVSTESLDAKQLQEYEELLQPYGVVLSEGLHYLGGSICQYRKIASFFLESYSQDRCEIEELLKNEDWRTLSLHVHSLKSRARAVGADDLFKTSVKLEKLCNENKKSHIVVVFPVLLWELDRVQQGLSAFISCMEPCPSEQSNLQTVDTETGSIQNLYNMLRHHRHYDALGEVDRLIITESDPEKIRCLREIWLKIDGIAYREAEHLLRNYEERCLL